MTVSTAAALAAVYAPLVARAERYVGQDAEDVVLEAVERWLVARRKHRGHLRAAKVALQSEAELAAWLGTTMSRVIIDRARRPSADVLSQAPLSLDEDWARR